MLSKKMTGLLAMVFSILSLVLVVVLGLAISPTLQTPQGKPSLEKPAALINPPSGQGLPRKSEKKEDHDLLDDKQAQIQQDHMDSSGRVRADLWEKGAQAFKLLPVVVAEKRPLSRKGPEPAVVVGRYWSQIGPQPLRIDIPGAGQNYQGAGPDSGEVTDIAIDPTGPGDTVIYIATNNGGIWKSVDGGASWSPKTDNMISQSMGAVTLDPDNSSIVYAGTGNLFAGGRSFSSNGVGGIFRGVGIYRSFDGGDTWTILNPGGAFTGKGVNRIVVPTHNMILVATNAGVYRSADGGSSFSQVAAAGQYVSDIDVDTGITSTIYAAISGTGILRSTDSGATFGTNIFRFTAGGSNNVTPALTSTLFTAFAQSVLTPNVAMTATIPNTMTMYASVQGPNTNVVGSKGYSGLYKSTDAGANWTFLTGTVAVNASAHSIGNGYNGGGNFQNDGQYDYDLIVGVDPQNANRVYIGFQELFLSTDGGRNFGSSAPYQDGEPISYHGNANSIHYDLHAITFSPRSHWAAGGAPTRMWIGSDGGIHRTDDAGANWVQRNQTLATNLFFSLDMGRGSTANIRYTYGGTQDTGTIEHKPGDADNIWGEGIDADGETIAVNPTNPQVAFGTTNRSLWRTADGGATWTAPAGTGLPGTRFVANVMTFDPSGSPLYVASASASTSDRLYKSTNNGANFSSVKTAASDIRSIAVMTDSTTLWLGLQSGKVLRSTDAGASWSAELDPGAVGQPATGIAVSPVSTTTVVVVYAGFLGGGANHVFLTTNNGANWAAIGGNLPDLPLHSVIIDPYPPPTTTIIVSNDVGVAQTTDRGATWQALGLGLPTVDGQQLVMDRSVTTSTIRLGTYGRSAWELTAPHGPKLVVSGTLNFGKIDVKTNVYTDVRLYNVGDADLHIFGFDRTAGNSAFTNFSGPPPPPTVTISPGGSTPYTMRFRPTGPGDLTATFTISSDDMNLVTSTYQLPASGSAPGVAHYLSPQNGLTVYVGDEFNLDLRIDDSPYNVISQATYLTFTNSLLQNVDPASGINCVLTDTLKAVTTSFDTVIQNHVCNGPDPCAFPDDILSAGNISFVSQDTPPYAGNTNFSIAQIGLCATNPGQAVLRWRFSPSNRNTRLVDVDTNTVSLPANYVDYIINILPVPTATPTNTPSVTPSVTSTRTPSVTPTSSRTATPFGTPLTPSPSPTRTRTGGTATRTPTLVPTAPSITNTPTITRTPTSTPTITPTPVCPPSNGFVNITGFQFVPQVLTVVQDTTVFWTNSDGTTHTSTSDTAVWNSGNIGPGGFYSFTFHAPGSYSYHCAIHPSMTGTINVLAGCSTPTPTQTSTQVPTNTPTQTPFGTPFGTPTNTPTVGPGIVLVGHVTWQGHDFGSGQSLPLTLTLKSGATEVNYPQQTTDASGFFTADVSFLTPGSYNWRVKGPNGVANPPGSPGTPGYLAVTGSVSLTGAPSLQSEMGTQKAGDLDGDNTVGLFDFNILKNTFGRIFGQPGYDGRADCDGSNDVGLTDFTLLKSNFGQLGPGGIRPGQ